MNKEQEVIQGFRSSAKTLGFIFVTIALVCNFVPAIYVSTITGQFPSVSQLLQLWLAAAAAFGVGYIVQPVSFFPIVNMAGTFMCWIAGNVGEVRAPAANMAQKVTNCEQGTPKAEIMSCIGICASVFVTVIMISFFIIMLTSIGGILVVPKLGIPGGMTMLINIIIAVLVARCYFMATKK